VGDENTLKLSHGSFLNFFLGLRECCRRRSGFHSNHFLMLASSRRKTSSAGQLPDSKSGIANFQQQCQQLSIGRRALATSRFELI
jgi:hypothetical protein